MCIRQNPDILTDLIKILKIIVGFFIKTCIASHSSRYLQKNLSLMKLQETNEQCCLECGKELYGRRDKKFCSLNCKNTFHNRIEQQSKKIRNSTVRVLEENYKILDDLLKDGIRSICIEELEDAGYRSAAITGFLTSGRGHYEMSCFDIRFSQSSSRIFNIRREAISRQSAPSPDPSIRR